MKTTRVSASTVRSTVVLAAASVAFAPESTSRRPPTTSPPSWATGSRLLTDRGKYYEHQRTLEGFEVHPARWQRDPADIDGGRWRGAGGADRQMLGKITKDGVYLEELEHNPAQYLPEVEQALGSEVVKIDLNKPMKEILAQLTRYPIKTRLSLTGPMVVARDLAHADVGRRRLDDLQDVEAPFERLRARRRLGIAGLARG